MLSLDYYVLSLMVLLILTGVNCEELTAVKTEESSLEDSTVTLSYKYHKAVDYNDNFFWYRQYPGEPPTFLISHSGTQNATESRLSAKVSEDQTHVDLQISSAAVTDSALYYCAVRPNSGGKLTFGSGTSLTIDPREEYKPSFYKLGYGDTQACLATGFSRYQENKNNSLFKNTEAIRINEDSLYNQLAFISSAQDEEQCEEGEGSGQCDDALEPDPKVNVASLITLVLRLLLLKTVVFNILMTFRLWISQ